MCELMFVGGADDLDRERQCATDLVGLAPNILFASGTLSVSALQRVSHSTTDSVCKCD